MPEDGESVGAPAGAETAAAAPEEQPAAVVAPSAPVKTSKADRKSSAPQPIQKGIQKDFKICLGILVGLIILCTAGILVIHFSLIKECNGVSSFQLPNFKCISDNANGTGGGNGTSEGAAVGGEPGAEEKAPETPEGGEGAEPAAPAEGGAPAGRRFDGGVAYDAEDPFKDIYEDDKDDLEDLIFDNERPKSKLPLKI